MADEAGAGLAGGEGRHLLLYDGVCGLCDRLVQFVLTHDGRGLFRFAPLQSATGRALIERSGADPDDLTTFYVVRDYGSPRAQTLVKGRAALFVARALGWPLEGRRRVQSLAWRRTRLGLRLGVAPPLPRLRTLRSVRDSAA
jgi:predicted DCC family thiol-disulfide oxidoreductase YuxK